MTLLRPAILLAGGRSQRMGRVKALLELGGQTLLARVAATLERVGFQPRVAVLGHHRAAIEPEARAAGMQVAVNPDPDGDQLSSLRVGIEALPDDSPGALVLPVDHAGVRAGTFDQVADQVARHLEKIVVPSYRFRRGHPTWFPRSALDELCDPGLEGGARTVLRRDPGRVVHVEVEDPWVLKDLDTPADWEALRSAQEEGR